MISIAGAQLDIQQGGGKEQIVACSVKKFVSPPPKHFQGGKQEKCVLYSTMKKTTLPITDILGEIFTFWGLIFLFKGIFKVHEGAFFNQRVIFLLGAKLLNFGVITLKYGVFIQYLGIKINQIQVQIINIWWHSKKGANLSLVGQFE